MAAMVRCRRIKELRFRKPDGSLIALEVPSALNQDLLVHADRREYVVLPVVTGRSVAESEVATLKLGSDIVGFLIPGQTILSPDQRLNSDRLFGTYSLIAAMEVCRSSHAGNYTLASPSVVASDSPGPVFHEGVFYLVAWLKKLDVASDSFLDQYFVSLARAGICSFIQGSKPLQTRRTRSSYMEPIALKRNQNWPEYVKTIFSELAPHAADPFLRFFYLYQVIETLMGDKYRSALGPILNDFKAEGDLSVSQLRDYIEKFQGVYREKPRINAALSPVCTGCEDSAKRLLVALGEKTEVPFGELIYKVRNIIFHDYSRVHAHSALVADLEDFLASYLIEQHLS